MGVRCFVRTCPSSYRRPKFRNHDSSLVSFFSHFSKSKVHAPGPEAWICSWEKQASKSKISEKCDSFLHKALMFPRDPTLRQKWFELCGSSEEYASKFPVLCSLHFSSDDIKVLSTGRTVLTKTALPIVFNKENVMAVPRNPPPLRLVQVPKPVSQASERQTSTNVETFVGILHDKKPIHLLKKIQVPHKTEVAHLPPLAPIVKVPFYLCKPLRPARGEAPQGSHNDFLPRESQENQPTKNVKTEPVELVHQDELKRPSGDCEEQNKDLSAEPQSSALQLESLDQFLRKDVELRSKLFDKTLQLGLLRKENSELRRQCETLKSKSEKDNQKLEAMALRHQQKGQARTKKISALKQQVTRMREKMNAMRLGLDQVGLMNAGLLYHGYGNSANYAMSGPSFNV